MTGQLGQQRVLSSSVPGGDPGPPRALGWSEPEAAGVYSPEPLEGTAEARCPQDGTWPAHILLRDAGCPLPAQVGFQRSVCAALAPLAFPLRANASAGDTGLSDAGRPPRTPLLWPRALPSGATLSQCPITLRVSW